HGTGTRAQPAVRHQAGKGRGRGGCHSSCGVCGNVALLSAHTAAVRVLSLPCLQHEGDSAGLAPLSRAGNPLFLAERGGGSVLSGGGWAALDPLRRRVLAAVSPDAGRRPSGYCLI